MESRIIVCDLETVIDILTLASENGQFSQGFLMQGNQMSATKYALTLQYTTIFG